MFGLPCCFCWTLVTSILGFVSLVVLKLLYRKLYPGSVLKRLNSKTVFITGGSSGIGLEIAKLSWKYGANVIICGRNVDKLLMAKKTICGHEIDNETRVHILPLDVTSKYDVLEASLNEYKSKIDILIHCAGQAVSRHFCDTTAWDIEAQMHLNYLASANITRIILPFMMQAIGAGNNKHVVFVSSMAGQLGLYGLAAYSASKFALRGLAESLKMELIESNVRVCLAFPPDTDTPGYKTEQIGKPNITKNLCETAGLISPEKVARKILRSSLAGDFLCYLGMDGFILNQLCQGMVLPNNAMELLSLLILSPLVRVIGVFYALWMRRVVRKSL